jgi:hypothetical protein
MNDARRLDLSTYFRIDFVDHLLKNAAIFYCIWKYWHAPKNHALAMVIVLAHDIYLECAEGKINSEWHVPEKKILSFFNFRNLLSTQMLTYKPTGVKYPGDEKMRAVTGLSVAKRNDNNRRLLDTVTLAKVRKAKWSKSSRLYGDMTNLCHHLDSVVRTKHSTVCAWCGLGGAYTFCGKCKDENGKKVSLHHNCKSGYGKGALCFYRWHDDMCFGLAKNDASQLLKQSKGDWKEPTAAQIEENKSVIGELLEQL